MDGTLIAALSGWTAAGVHAAYTYWPKKLPEPDPVTDGWHCIVQNAAGQTESVRRINDGSAPTRIHRGHGKLTPTWYRLVKVDGLSLIYQPEP